MFAIIRDAWRRQKCSIKKNHFSKYKNMRDRLKNRPEDVPEAHFRELIDYWRLEAIKLRYIYLQFFDILLFFHV